MFLRKTIGHIFLYSLNCPIAINMFLPYGICIPDGNLVLSKDVFSFGSVDYVYRLKALWIHIASAPSPTVLHCCDPIIPIAYITCISFLVCMVSYEIRVGDYQGFLNSSASCFPFEGNSVICGIQDCIDSIVWDRTIWNRIMSPYQVSHYGYSLHYIQKNSPNYGDVLIVTVEAMRYRYGTLRFRREEHWRYRGV